MTDLPTDFYAAQQRITQATREAESAGTAQHAQTTALVGIGLGVLALVRVGAQIAGDVRAIRMKR